MPKATAVGQRVKALLAFSPPPPSLQLSSSPLPKAPASSEGLRRGSPFGRPSQQPQAGPSTAMAQALRGLLPLGLFLQVVCLCLAQVSLF